MTTPAEARRIEQRSLRFGVGANALMALAGFLAHVLTGSSALLASPLLLVTPLSALVPITDALLVLAVSLALLREPLAALRDAMAQAAGCAADPDVLQRTRMVLMQELVGLHCR